MKRKKVNVIVETLGRLFFIVPRMPGYAQIEITNDCNLRCKMCPREFLKVPFKHMDYDVYKKVVDKLDSVHTLTLTGWGEPFYYDKIFDCIEYATKKGMDVKLTTNGVLLNDSKIQKIFSSGLKEITFSVDNIRGDPDLGHPNKVALTNIKKIIKIKKEKKLEYPHVVLQPTMQYKKNHNVIDVIKWGAKVKADRINIARLTMQFDPKVSKDKLKRATESDEQKLFLRADKLGKKLGIRVDMAQYAIFSGFSRMIYKIIRKLLHRFDKKCSKTFNYVYINVDGFATPCCLFPNMKRGDLKKQTLEEIWNGELFKIFRKNQEKICGPCDVMKIRYLDRR